MKIQDRTYLYLLPFDNGEHFKIGISTNNDNRIKHHHWQFGLNLDKCLVVTANKDKTIVLLERELLNTFDDEIVNIDYSEFDGYTEIRDMSCFNEVVDLIKSKSDRLGIAIEKYSQSIIVNDDRIKKDVVKKVNNKRCLDVNLDDKYKCKIKGSLATTKTLIEVSTKIKKVKESDFIVTVSKSNYDNCCLCWAMGRISIVVNSCISFFACGLGITSACINTDTVDLHIITNVSNWINKKAIRDVDIIKIIDIENDLINVLNEKI